jgi:hypothetical protein
MPIAVRDFADPLSLAAQLGAPSAPIESAAYRQLVHDLKRYCQGEITGRSFLIAGHRGSGKTTLVANAFAALLAEADQSPLLARPLYVSILGPALLPDGNAPLPTVQEAKGDTPARTLTPDENILVQLILSLYRAATNELVRAYRRRISTLAGAPPWVDSPSGDAIAGLGAQLELELDEYTGRPRLREFWERAHALRQGVLRDPSAGDSAMPPGTGTPPVSRLDQQGARELVALSSLCEAYRRISGTLTRKEEAKAGAKNKTEQTTEMNAKGTELAGPLLALLGGGTVATGAATAGVQPTSAALTGLLAAFFGLASTKYVRTRERERSQASEDLFIPDLSVSSLDRLLPLLLRRLMDAGLAPVFVIDELDKVQKLSKRMPSIVRRLKKLVAESAYFCFLTDRLYFEQMRERDGKAPYSIEYTYFTSQLFVSFSHVDLHDYLDRVLEVSEPPLDASAAERQLAKDEAQDRVIWPYYLLHAAQMHPIDIRRQLDWFRGSNRTAELRAGDVRTRLEYRLPVMAQVALELVLGDKEVTLELNRDPPFRRFVHDALYFISREWEKEDPYLDLSDSKLKDFRDYLLGRLAPQADEEEDAVPRPAEGNGVTGAQPTNDAGTPPAAPKGAGVGSSVPPAPAKPAQTPRSTPTDGDSNLPPERAKFLWARVRELAGLLANPETVRNVARERGFPSVVIEAIKSDEPLLTPLGHGSLKYEWRFYRACHPRSTTVVTAAGKRPSVPPPSTLTGKAERDFIQRFSRALAPIAGTSEPIGWFASGIGVIARTPAWPSVVDAMTRLEERVEYAEKPADVAIVRECDALLQRSAIPIARALFAGRLVRPPGAAEADRLRVALSAVSDALELLHVEESVAVARVAAFTRSALKLAGEPVVPDWQGNDAIESWWKSVDTWLKQADAERMTLDDKTLARAATDFFRGTFLGDHQLPDYRVVAAALSKAGPFEALGLRTEEITIREWSRAFYLAQARADWPAWFSVAALVKLGFTSIAAAVRERATVGKPLPLVGLPSQLVTPESKDILERLLVATEQTVSPTLFVSRSASPAETWMPGDLPLMMLREDELEQLGDLMSGLNATALVIDATGEDVLQPFERKLFAKGPRTVALEYVTRAKAHGIPVLYLDGKTHVPRRDALEWIMPMPDSPAGLRRHLNFIGSEIARSKSAGNP